MIHVLLVEQLCNRIKQKGSCSFWCTYDAAVKNHNRCILRLSHDDEIGRHKENLRFLLAFFTALTDAISEKRINMSREEKRSSFNLYGYIELELRRLDG
jgi:hypothetical protein